MLTSGSAAGRAPGQAEKRVQRGACRSPRSSASTRGTARPNCSAPEALLACMASVPAALPLPPARRAAARPSCLYRSSQAAAGVAASMGAPLPGVTLQINDPDYDGQQQLTGFCNCSVDAVILLSLRIQLQVLCHINDKLVSGTCHTPFGNKLSCSPDYRT